ncbi:MAG: hypothetical protein K2X43_07210 [Hyphomonadaceae bacterium]|jgi:hypothetical protein|nr:hypothetical protein [Hyphomonadaceae bacterium]
MLVRLSIALILSAFVAAPAGAADEPKAFACSFTSGVTHVYDNGQFTPEKASALAFGITRINAQAQTADLKTERGIGPLRIVHAVNATHFLEVVTEGSLHITTVFDKDDATGLYPAVHSRHFGLFGQPIVTQYHGFCEAKE